jgi:hypothetical protein
VYYRECQRRSSYILLRTAPECWCDELASSSQPRWHLMEEPRRKTSYIAIVNAAAVARRSQTIYIYIHVQFYIYIIFIKALRSIYSANLVCLCAASPILYGGHYKSFGVYRAPTVIFIFVSHFFCYFFNISVGHQSWTFSHAVTQQQ